MAIDLLIVLRDAVCLVLFLLFAICVLTEQSNHKPSSRREDQLSTDAPPTAIDAEKALSGRLLTPECREGLRALIAERMKGNDASHDARHVNRVVALALMLLVAFEKKCGVVLDAIAVQIAALLHDLFDPKYHKGHASQKSQKSGEEAKSSDVDLKEEFERILRPYNIAPATVTRVVAIVERMGYHSSFDQGQNGQNREVPDYVDPVLQSVGAVHEMQIVSEADMLDALGATGLARMLTFAASKKRPIFDETIPPAGPFRSAEEYYAKSKDSTAFNHIYEKLLHLPKRFRTDLGCTMADERATFLEVFARRLIKEMEEAAADEAQRRQICHYCRHPNVLDVAEIRQARSYPLPQPSPFHPHGPSPFDAVDRSLADSLDL